MKGYTKSTDLPKWYLSYAKAMASNFPDLSIADRLAELYKRLSWVATAIDVVSIIGAMAEKSVKKIIGEEEEDIVNHEFELLLLDPNPINSGRSFIYAIIADYKLYNKAFIWMNIVGNKPVELWRIPPTMIAPKTDGRLGIAYYIYDPGFGGEKINIPVEQIVYWQGYDPQDLINPASNLTSLSLTSSSDLTMQKWNNHLYDGNGRLPGVLHFADMIPDAQWEQIGDDIDEAANTQNILRLRGTGSGAIGYIQTSSPPKDMEFYVGRDNNRDEIWTRIAPGLVSALSADATEANSRTGKATLIDLTVYPVLCMLYETITQQIIWRYYGKDLKIEPDDIRVTDRVLELREKQEHGKALTLDEYRTLWGDDAYHDPVVGKMLLAEAQKYKSEKPPEPINTTPALPFGQDNEDEDKKPSTETSNEQRDIQAVEKQVTQKTYKDPRPAMLELEKWERMAKKSTKKSFEFECYNIPREVTDNIKAELPKCGNVTAIKMLFENARNTVKGEWTDPAVKMTDAALVLEGIRLALAERK